MATKDKVSDVRPYVERAMQDEELRDNLKAAFVAARDVYGDLMGNRGMTGLATRVATDKEIQDNLKQGGRRAARGERPRARQGGPLRPQHVPAPRRDHARRALQPGDRAADAPWIKEKILGPTDDFTYGGETRRRQTNGGRASRFRRLASAGTAGATPPRPLTGAPVSSTETGFAMARRSEPGSRPFALEMSVDESR